MRNISFLVVEISNFHKHRENHLGKYRIPVENQVASILQQMATPNLIFLLVGQAQLSMENLAPSMSSKWKKTVARQPTFLFIVPLFV